MAKSFRILTFLHSFEPGGVERVALRLNAAWRARGVDAQVVLGRPDGAMREEAPPLDYHYLERGGLRTRWFETLWMIMRLPGVIRRQAPDILFCAGNTYAVVAVAMRLLLGRRCPPIVAKISNDLERRDLGVIARQAYYLWLRIQARAIGHFVGMAAPMKSEIAIAMWISETRVAIIEDPALTQMEHARLARSSRPERRAGESRHFVAAGRLVAQKNFALLLRAFASGAGSEDRLTIFGEGPERRSLERLASRIGIAERVNMPGHVRRWAEQLSVADAFLVSSDYEGVPAVVIEALAAGAPIIATACSVSMADLLGAGRFGRLVPVGDVDALARAIATIGDRGFCVAGARAQAGRFTVEHAADAYLAVMRESARLVSVEPASGAPADFSVGRRPVIE
ncbi:glycosyltransferase [Sphingomonas sp. ID1715]|uniref:glycosyltransferase n=1 Tax=Sphingomonas sp. ID1715 TaxID=1656898 RepID=UPI001487CACA|nr:glycosyltransferase [Sphingomonas sp. ID1715]NNM77723.1 glycosyltransferase [Sphingomonas sp. ID1715]